ncbi:MAG: GH92 family glycosyl hydrolase [Porphyromonadaceae bacterium]|nr:GH92 family glycosyl hydrolase [Porphyromonadaceae bacterium]
MRSKQYILALFLALEMCQGLRLQAQTTPIAHPSPVDLVNPLVGTLSSFELSSGNTYPVVSRPWGMNSWTPQTGRMGDGWQYTYTATKIRGFKQTHQPSPWINDYGQFALLPQVGEQPVFDEEQRASWFSHKAELARPYCYEVYLADYDTRVRLAPSERAAVFEVDYPQTSLPQQRWVLLDAFDSGSEIRQLDSCTLVGFSRKNSGGVPDNFRNYFVVRFDTPIDRVRLHSLEGKSGTHAQMAVSLRPTDARLTTFRVASSFISQAQALQNLEEVVGKSYRTVRDEGRTEWNRLMRRIEVEDEPEKSRTFYSNLYRSMLFPRRFYEITHRGDTLHYSPYNGQILPGYMYTDTGFWDTFRSLSPLVNLVFPEEGTKMQEGLLNAYRESGFFPEWASPGHRDCMVGNNSASVVADAYLKGLGRVDPQELIVALEHGANHAHPTVKSTGRLGYQYYNQLGYVPCDVGINESAARSLEYAYNDWCIYQVLKRAGAKPTLQRLYKKRAMNYRNLFDTETGWMRGRTQAGKFQTPFSPFKWGDAFTEGNALHYTWSVFHDVQGLIDLMGGDDAFVSRLDSIFALPPIFDDSYYGFVIHEIREMQIMDMGNYAHGNQPIQHMIYLYNYAGQPYKAQHRIRQVMQRLYSHAPDGYCGDEDNGQTSAWYVFSALGFYPVTPASDQYVIGVPYFRSVRLNLPNGRTTLIEAEGTEHPYIQSVKRNGKSYGKTYVQYQDLLEGGRYVFTLGEKPSAWGTDPKARPYSFSGETVK